MVDFWSFGVRACPTQGLLRGPPLYSGYCGTLAETPAIHCRWCQLRGVNESLLIVPHAPTVTRGGEGSAWTGCERYRATRMEPDQMLAFSMVSLLLLGFVAQMMQQQGGATARAAPFVTVILMLLITTVAIVWMQQSLATRIEWREATSWGSNSRSTTR